jgi:hypothetical protein
MVMASVAQGLTLMTLESTVCVRNSKISYYESCKMSFGAFAAIGAVGCWSMASFFLLSTGRVQVDNEFGRNSAQSDMQSFYGRKHQKSSEETSDVNDETKASLSDAQEFQDEIPIQHGTGRFKFVDIWGKMV